jgi:hypothetical protein
MRDREKLKEEEDEIITISINTTGWHLANENFSPPAFFPT